MKCFNSTVLLLFILQIILHAKSGRSVENFERKLVRKILKDYDKAVRPSVNATLPLNVTFGLSLTQIIDVDERNQILTTNCWLNQMWIDYSLRWNPADYGGIKVVRIPATNVWRPDIILYNNADSQYNLAILSTNVIVTSDGNLTWLSTAIFKSSCQINVEFFPFDEQQCEMKFASWTYDGFQVNLVIQTEEGDLSNYVSNGEWDLIHMQQKRHVVYYSCCLEPYPDITYYIVLRRRPLFYVFNLILPCVLISGLALLSFYMPSDSGEKVTLGITTLLSMTVFLMVIGESMPPTSEKLPLIGLYYGVTITLVSFATGLSVVTLNIHHRGMRGRKLPSGIRAFIFNILARIVFLRLDFPKREDEKLKEGEDGAPTPPQGRGSRKLPMGDTWRIVYPDMPSTPTNISTSDAHHALLDKWQIGKKEQNHIFGSSGHLPRERRDCSNCSSSNLKLRPVPKECHSGGKNSKSLYLNPSKNTRTQDDSSLHLKSNSINNTDSTHNFSYDPSPPFLTCYENRMADILQRLVVTMEKNEVRMSEQDKKDNIKLEWQQAALILDRVLLWIFVAATVGATFGILYMSPHTKLFST